MGFDDIDVSPYLGLSTVRQPLYQSGRRAAEMLLCLLSGDEEVPGSVEMPVEVVARVARIVPRLTQGVGRPALIIRHRLRRVGHSEWCLRSPSRKSRKPLTFIADYEFAADSESMRGLGAEAVGAAPARS